METTTRIEGNPASSWLTKILSLVGGIAMMLLAASALADLKTGDPAPDFKLSASDGKTYTLSQFKGKKPVVIAFFPKAFTGG